MSEKDVWRGGELIAWALKQEGVECIFGLSGGHINSAFDACIDFGIRIIDTRHEQAAVNMAEGWARATGKPGVALVTAGPGVVNAIPGVAVAQQSASPVVLIGGRSSVARRDIGSMQDMDQLEILRPLTKWARSAYGTGRIAEYVSMAFRHATSGRPGPVFLEIPVDILDGQAGKDEVIFPSSYRTESRPGGNPGDIEKAAELIRNAERPVLVAGGGVWWSDAGEEFKAFVEATNMPFYTRSHARGTVPDDHPLAGGFFPAGLTQADVCILLGTRLDWTIAYGRPPIFNQDIKVIQIDIEPEEIGKNRPIDAGVFGDAKVALGQLREALEGKYRGPDSWIETTRAMKAGIRTQYAGDVDKQSDRVHPAKLVAEMRDAMPRNALCMVDGGDICIFGNLLLDALAPGSLTWVGGFGHLGVSIPYAIAAKTAHPDRPVFTLTGDGSVGFSIMEFDTAVRHKIPFVCIVANDEGWGQIRRGQINTYGKDRVIGSELPYRPYHKIVEALGATGSLWNRCRISKARSNEP